MIETRPAQFADALRLAPQLRFDDAREIASSWGVGAREGLLRCLLGSDRAFALVEAGNVLALWGVSGAAHEDLELGVPWLLAGDSLFRRRRWLVRSSRAWVDRLLLDYDALTNLTDERNQAHLRWLAWSGFQPLRRLDRYGLAGEAFQEFFRVNGRRPLAERAVRRQLLQRAPHPAVRAELPLLSRLVDVALDCLTEGARRHPPPDYPGLLQELDELLRGGRQPRLLRRGLQLLLEVAPVMADGAGPGVGASVAEWFERLMDVVETLCLEPGPLLAADVAGLLAPSASAGRGASRSGRAGAAEPPDGRVVLRAMIERYRFGLTLRDRVSPVQGYRLHAAAIGRDGASAAKPLGQTLAALTVSASEHHLAAWLRGGAEGGSLARQQALQQIRLHHGQAVARMQDCVPVGGPLRAAVRRALDEGFAATGDGAALPEITSVCTAAAAVSVVAERVARALMPGARVGGVVAGCEDRQWLSRLLRLSLVTAAAGRSADCLEPLFANEFSGLLVAARVQSALLAAGGDADTATRLVLCDMERIWGPAAGLDPVVLRAAVALVLPGLLVPVLHELQLAPALAVWRMAGRGREAWMMSEMAEVFGSGAADARPGFRKFLRVLPAHGPTLGSDSPVVGEDPNAQYPIPAADRPSRERAGPLPVARPAVPSAARAATGPGATDDQGRGGIL